MSASQAQALTAVAFQLAATLDSYDENVARLLRTPGDTDLYSRVSRQVDEMRMYAAALPPLSVAWVEVLIRHFEITHGFWRAQQDPGAVDLHELRQRHQEAVERLSRKCVQLMPRA
jgi:hypothetical protein